MRSPSSNSPEHSPNSRPSPLQSTSGPRREVDHSSSSEVNLHDIDITAVSAADVPELISFWDGVEGVMLSGDDTVESLTSVIEQNPNLSIIARNPDGIIVGAVLGTSDGRRGYLRHLVVDPELREHGLGTAVVRAAELAMKAHGISGVAILVQKDNPGGHTFWERTGYSNADQVLPMFKRL